VREISLRQFIADFGSIHKLLTNRKFVWVLGAGASRQSGIPLGSELVDQWLEQMRLREDGEDTPPNFWATEKRLEIKNFTYAERANFYSQIYQRRFRFLPEEGYAYLEEIMVGKEPSPGYSILAAALAVQPTRHNIVITTNFDNLMAQALSIYTDAVPLIVGHESLAEFVDASVRQPIVCKIHRDLFLAPKNDYRSLQRLHESWGKAIRTLFQQYTPIFIGYGGNDNTLMNLLESLEPDEISGPRPYWCQYQNSEPSDRIRNVVANLNGHLVMVPDFDSLMIMIGVEMGIGLQDGEIDERAAERKRQYTNRIIALGHTGDPMVDRSLAALRERAGGWWAWYQKARAESDLSRRVDIYREGIRRYPDSAALRGNFANFLTDLSYYTEAREMYEEALRLDPGDSLIRRNFAIFLTEALNEPDEGERQYRKAVEADPENAILITNFANFLSDVRKKDDEAEQLYREALELEPKNAGNASDYASFLWHIRGSYIQADWLYRTAYQLSPKSAEIAGNYAGFLLCYERLDDVLRFIDLAKSLNAGEKNQLAAELALYEAIARKANGRDNHATIRELESLLARGFRRSKWSFDCVLAVARARLPADYPQFKAFAEQILNGSDLESSFEKWRT
jgi:Tfp pilus assembly protein PilF